MAVVSNTSPLLNLAIIGHLNLIVEQFPLVLIPDAVQTELQVNTNLPGSVHLRTALQKGWLKAIQVNNVHAVQILRSTLDRGEAEAIALALEHGVTQILLDEYDGREMARMMGLQPIGILGILLEAKKRGSILAVKPLIFQLRSLAGFFITQTLEQQIIQAAEE